MDNMKRELVAQNYVNMDNNIFTLKYYVCDKNSEGMDHQFGIEVVKSADEHDDAVGYCDICDEKETAVRLANLFASNFVTPVSLEDIVKDMIGQN